ncbi:GRIM-19 domain-containing protein [Tieghemostelium lacteum]|uniref:NADH dehydrogenase [ubiquinone] 1 alpha subcomplex subunit 13 n=1 Tax=Tieghemostelium lacteum TaxID=361077 RepID=A0A151Z606_TIELA|nr:GRIM-19 domain-containing protein [Tieghemostelium lacteum]|eukprot:KYQ89392.1 GRIM-19 domain-containing protein [Tieghemostelium lacteum]
MSGLNYKQRWVQDLPPPGGYPKLEYGRKIPPPISGYWVFGITFAIMGVGTVIFFNDKIERMNQEKEEKKRLSMILPILQAENDINFLASSHQNVYTTRWMPPQIQKRQLTLLPKEWGKN